MIISTLHQQSIELEKQPEITAHQNFKNLKILIILLAKGDKFIKLDSPIIVKKARFLPIL